MEDSRVNVSEKMDKIVVTSCHYCNGNISPEEDKCSACDTSIEEMLRLAASDEGKIRSTNIIGRNNECGSSNDYKASNDGAAHRRYGDDDDNLTMDNDLSDNKHGSMKNITTNQDLNRDISRSNNNDGVVMRKENVGKLKKKDDDDNNERGTNNYEMDKKEGSEGIMKNTERENGGMHGRQGATNDVREEKDKTDDGYRWICGQCGFRNKYNFVTCEVCNTVGKDTPWVCGRCTVENKCDNDECETCGIINDKGKKTVITETNVSRDKNESTNDTVTCDKCRSVRNKRQKQCDKCDEEGWKDKWKCGKCLSFQSYDVIVCTACGDRRICGGQWRCSKCTVVNKCEATMCAVCGEPNDYLMIKYCKWCTKINVTNNKEYCYGCSMKSYNSNKEASVKWQCKFTHCKAWSDPKDDYCHKCKIWRHSSCIRGHSVKQLSNYGHGTKNVWICFKCNEGNNLTNDICCGFLCHETRYGAQYCADCRKKNDGRSLNCDTCHKRL